MADLMLTTGDSFEGYEIKEYLGIVAGEAILGSNFIKGLTASMTNMSEQDMAKVEKAREDAESRCHSRGSGGLYDL